MRRDDGDVPADGVVVDRENRIVSTPAYMLGPSIRHVASGIERCVAEVLALVAAARRDGGGRAGRGRGIGRGEGSPARKGGGPPGGR